MFSKNKVSMRGVNIHPWYIVIKSELRKQEALDIFQIKTKDVPLFKELPL